MIYFKGRGFEIDEKIKIYKVLFEVKFELEVTETRDERTVKFPCSSSVLVLGIFFFCVLFCSMF